MCLCQNPQPHPPPKQGYWGRACIESGDTLIPSHLRHKLCKVPETPSGQRSDCSDLPKTRKDYTEEGRRFPGTGSDWGWSRLGGWARKGEHGLSTVNVRLSRSEISYSDHRNVGEQVWRHTSIPSLSVSITVQSVVSVRSQHLPLSRSPQGAPG